MKYTEHISSAKTPAAKPDKRFFNAPIQPKLTINQPNDAYEQEADAVAEKIMRMPANANAFFKPAPNSIQRKCAHCEEEEKLHRKEATINTGTAPAGVHQTINSTGKPLDASTKAFMEQRFGHDFSDVQVHDDSLAHHSSASINALAYTHKNHIAFAPGQYQPQTDEGKQLLAHELTHVIQQRKTPTQIQRKVDDRSSCKASVDPGAPPQPLTFITLADMLAGSHLSFAIVSLQLDLMSSSKNGVLAGSAFDAYRKRFGDPQPVKGGFKNRFDGSTHVTLGAAQEAEINSLIARLKSVQRLLDSGITYRCIGKGTWKVNEDFTFGKCKDDTVLKAPIASISAIAICPLFWQNAGRDDQGASIIHELFHIRFQYPDHDTKPAQTAAQRLSEPQCYAGFVADVNNVNSTDISCPVI